MRLTLLHALSDGAIAAAYFSIPTVMYFNRDLATEGTRPLLLMFAAFILSCGVGHVIAAWNIWHGSYWIEGLWKVIIALISSATVWQLRRAIPDLMRVYHRLDETELMANTDSLTGLKNRRGLEKALTRLSAVDTLRQSSHILMLLDLDHFKLINDDYGHAVGDRLLQSVAQMLENNTRSLDIVARLGGDEFAVILLGCSLSRGAIIAEKIREEISKISLEDVDVPRKGDCKPKVSIGLYPFQPTVAQTFEDVFRQADKMLYASKNAGRDRVTFSVEEMGIETAAQS